ncbi:unnamed protein product [Schistosoma rodhaini]|uniref:Tight junction-associated protein 1 n=1 Tax=Schistosoma mansoni TaxID=6183 RepID=A0A3Q0KSX9_SCHMA|nr:unnamed protein product [Schistosoma rodhaini]
MNELSQDPIEERYEMLKNLCKQQIVINETLKSEIIKLNNIIRVVSSEKDLLLDELINNHSTCRNAVKDESKPFQKSVISVGNKRPVNFSEDYQDLKKIKSDPTVADRNENAGFHSDSTSLSALNSISIQENEDRWNAHDQIQTNHSHLSGHSSLISTKPRLQYQTPSVQSKTNISVTPSGDSEISPRLLSSSGTTLKSSLSNPGSPPTITSNTHLVTPVAASSNNLTTTQRPNRGSSLVTNSSVCPSNPSIPYVSFASQRTPPIGSHSKYVSVTNRPLKVVSSGTVNNTAGNILKSVTSPPISPGIRLSGGQPTSQRILIQPSNCNVRSVVFPRQQSHANDSCEFGYAER